MTEVLKVVEFIVAEPEIQTEPIGQFKSIGQQQDEVLNAVRPDDKVIRPIAYSVFEYRQRLGLPSSDPIAQQNKDWEVGKLIWALCLPTRKK